MAKSNNFPELRLAQPILLPNKFLMKSLELHDLISKRVIGNRENDFEHFTGGDLALGEGKPCVRFRFLFQHFRL